MGFSPVIVYRLALPRVSTVTQPHLRATPTDEVYSLPILSFLRLGSQNSIRRFQGQPTNGAFYRLSVINAQYVVFLIIAPSVSIQKSRHDNNAAPAQ